MKYHLILHFSKRTSDVEFRYYDFELKTLTIFYVLKRGIEV